MQLLFFACMSLIGRTVEKRYNMCESWSVFSESECAVLDGKDIYLVAVECGAPRLIETRISRVEDGGGEEINEGSCSSQLVRRVR